jgi:hypothetical protein
MASVGAGVARDETVNLHTPYWRKEKGWVLWRLLLLKTQEDEKHNERGKNYEKDFHPALGIIARNCASVSVDNNVVGARTIVVGQ